MSSVNLMAAKALIKFWGEFIFSAISHYFSTLALVLFQSIIAITTGFPCHA